VCKNLAIIFESSDIYRDLKNQGFTFSLWGEVGKSEIPRPNQGISLKIRDSSTKSGNMANIFSALSNMYLGESIAGKFLASHNK